MRLAYATGARARSRRLVAGACAVLSIQDLMGPGVNQHRLRALRALYRATDLKLPRCTLLWLRKRGGTRDRSALNPSTTARE